MDKDTKTNPSIYLSHELEGKKGESKRGAEHQEKINFIPLSQLGGKKSLQSHYHSAFIIIFFYHINSQKWQFTNRPTTTTEPPLSSSCCCHRRSYEPPEHHLCTTTLNSQPTSCCTSIPLCHRIAREPLAPKNHATSIAIGPFCDLTHSLHV